MNRLPARLVRTVEHEGVCRIETETFGHPLTLVALAPLPPLHKDDAVTLGVHATHLIPSLQPPRGLGVENALPVTITEIDCGVVLATLQTRFEAITLEAIVPATQVESLSLTPGRRIWLLCRASDVAILKEGM